MSGSVGFTKVMVSGVSTPITATLAAGTYPIDTSSCTGLSAASGNYTLQYATSGNTFTRLETWHLDGRV